MDTLETTASDEVTEVLDPLSNAGMDDFETFFHSLSYTEKYPNRSVPMSWLMEQHMILEEIVEEVMDT